MGGIVNSVKNFATAPIKLLQGDVKGAAKGMFDPTGLMEKGAGALGIKLEDEQGAYVTPEEQRAKDYQAFLGDYSGEMGKAEKGVQESAMTKGLFGAGGLQEQLGREQQDLSSRGFQLTQGDREAYGQTAGDVSRLFGQQEQAATQNLARRGLASGASGAAGAAFSGIQGNKNEMLAQAQTQIAQKRMADTQQRLQQTRQQMQSLGGMGSDLANQRYSTKGRALGGAVDVQKDIEQGRRQAISDQEAAVKPGLFSTIGQGLQRGIGQMAQAAPGMLVGGIGGGLGGAATSGGSGQMAGLFGQGGGAQAGSALGTPNQTLTMLPSKRGGNYGNYA